jgi:hypothetical protein
MSGHEWFRVGRTPMRRGELTFGCRRCGIEMREVEPDLEYEMGLDRVAAIRKLRSCDDHVAFQVTTS